MNILETILSILALISLISGFIFWHMNSIKRVEKKFENEIKTLTEKHQRLKDEMKDLKHRDDLQQMAINGIKELWPLINDKIKKLDQ